MKKKTLSLLFAFIASSLLVSCGGEEASSSIESSLPSSEVSKKATWVDLTANSHYGKVTVENPDASYEAGDTIRFAVKAIDDFFVDKVTVNGEIVSKGEDGYYSYVLKRGVNKISASYIVDKDIDWVDRFKLNIDEDTFYNVMNAPEYLDFRVDGVEQMQTEFTSGDSAFVNYVDGDTTHVSTLNYGYTVKIRYLGIDTPESTSELEEWGKSASIYNKSVLSSAKHIILESQGWARGDENKSATADGNQRSLAYVWYTDKEDPALSDFRCLNLEMVYQGFSQGIGSIEDMGESFYWAFDAANKSAQVNKRHQYSGMPDPNYFYYSKDNPPVEKTLKEVYDSVTISSSPYTLSTPLFDVDDTHTNCSKTLYKLSGYVSRKINGAFYFQDKPSYEMPTDGTLPEAYGMYVFTYAQTPIKVGDYVSVIGVLSSYSGTLQMMGVSYHDFDADPYRDIKIDSLKSVSPDQIKPIELTKEQYNQYGGASNHKNLNHVLVSFKDEVYCYKDKTFADGGIHEVDRYNTHYPFYCTNNKLIFFGALGSSSDSSAVRIVEDQNVLVTYGAENSHTYKFYTGGTNYYNPAGAEYVYNYKGQSGNVLTTANAETEEEMAIAVRLITTEYQAKKIHLTGIWGNYISTSGKNYRDQITIVSSLDVNVNGTY